MAAMDPKDLGGPPPSPKPPPPKPMGSLPPAVAPPRARSPRSEPPPPVASSPLDGLFGAPAKPAASPAFSPEKSITEQLEVLDHWVNINRKATRRSVARFCLLKGPALVCVVAALVAQALAQGQGVIVLTAIAAVAIAIDAAWSGPSTQAHKRALADIRDLENSVKSTWDKVRIAHPDPRDPARSAEALAILDTIQKKREAISRSLAGRPEASSGEPQA